MDIELLGKLGQRPITLDGCECHLTLNAGVWFRRGRLGMVFPDSQATACPQSGRNSTFVMSHFPGPALIVFPVRADPVGAGFVDCLARPGGKRHWVHVV